MNCGCCDLKHRAKPTDKRYTLADMQRIMSRLAYLEDLLKAENSSNNQE